MNFLHISVKDTSPFNTSPDNRKGMELTDGRFERRLQRSKWRNLYLLIWIKHNYLLLKKATPCFVRPLGQDKNAAFIRKAGSPAPLDNEI